MDMNERIQKLRARASALRETDKETAAALDEAADALGDMQFRAGPVLAKQSMEAIRKQMRDEQAALQQDVRGLAEIRGRK